MDFPITIDRYFRSKYELNLDDYLDYFVNDDVLVMHAKKKKSIYSINIHSATRLNRIPTAHILTEAPTLISENIITTIDH